MANPIKRVFDKTQAQKAELSNANVKGSSCPTVGTEFALTGNFTVENGWLDRRTGEIRDKDRSYAFFEGKRNGKETEAGISAGVFLRRPFDGFTAEEEKSQTEFQKELLDCISAEDFFDLMQKKGWKTIVVKDIVRHMETPYDKKDEKPVRYAIFDLK